MVEKWNAKELIKGKYSENNNNDNKIKNRWTCIIVYTLDKVYRATTVEYPEPWRWIPSHDGGNPA